MNYKVIVLIGFSLFNKAIISQNDSSKAVIYFKEKGVIIYLDDKKIAPSKVLRPIGVGSHVIKAWAPKYNLFIDSFVVKKKVNEFYTRKLTYSENYLVYRHRLRLKKATYLIPGAMAIASSGVYFMINNNFDKRISKAYNDANSIKGEYNASFSPQEFEKNAADYNSKNEYYNKLQAQQKNMRVQGIIVSSALAATAVTFFIIKKTKKQVPFKETPLLSRITPAYNPFNHQLCLTIKLD